MKSATTAYDPVDAAPVDIIAPAWPDLGWRP
jgi:hypothetical protein